MAIDATHASFFSGVGGLDLGLERAGWRTVSFSEIDPYASAVLAQRWPGVPNLGDILAISAGPRGRSDARTDGGDDSGPAGGGRGEQPGPDGDWRSATLWTGGFPCQDLSVAGKRRGMGKGTRSGLAYAFLDLVGRHRPPLVLLENVPGLLSSHGGRDMAALLGAMADLGYGVAYRVLDARYFGVPQRRRRVFIVGVRSGPDDPDGRAAALRAAAVLAVGTRCGRHPATGHQAGEGAAEGTGGRVAPPVRSGGHGDPGIGRDNDHDRLIYNATAAFGQWAGPDAEAGNLSTRDYKSSNHLLVDGPPPDPDRVRAPDGLAGRVDGGRGLAATLNSGGNNGGFRTEPGEHLVYVKASRYGEHGDPRRPDGNEAETWKRGIVSSSLDAIGHTARTATAVIGASGMTHDEPDGLDSHRYRCCGNGVVAPVAEWLGQRLMSALRPSGLPEGHSAIPLDLPLRDGPRLPDEPTSQPSVVDLLSQRRGRQSEPFGGLREGEHLVDDRGDVREPDAEGDASVGRADADAPGPVEGLALHQILDDDLVAPCRMGGLEDDGRAALAALPFGELSLDDHLSVSRVVPDVDNLDGIVQVVKRLPA